MVLGTRAFHIEDIATKRQSTPEIYFWGPSAKYIDVIIKLRMSVTYRIPFCANVKQMYTL